jgi:hypothetical protein
MLSIAEICTPFLLRFQTDAPAFPFLYEELRGLLTIIGKKKFFKVVFHSKFEKNNLKDVNEIDIGFGASKALHKFDVAEISNFKEECQKFLKAMFNKIMTRCPLNNDVVKGASALSPLVMLNKKVSAERINLLLQACVENEVVDPTTAESVKREYLDMCENDLVISYLKTFRKNERLDDFLLKITDFHPLTDISLEFIKKVFIFFPSNSAVERSFSVNKECLVENLMDESLIAQRTVYDNIKDVDFKELEITPSMLNYFKSASSKRKEELKLKKREHEDDKTERKRINQELLILKIKKQKIEESKDEELAMLDANIHFLEKKLEK